MRIPLHLSRATAVKPSPHVLEAAAMFGLGIDRDKTIDIIPPSHLDLLPGQIVFVTGPSGSGKSSILHLIHDRLRDDADIRLIRFEDLAPPADAPLVDVFGDLPLGQVMSLLSLAGLNDAFVMLRKPSELSDGQRYRLRLALAMARAQGSQRSGLVVVLADEFGAALDRVTAKVIAVNVRKWVSRRGDVCFVCATTHDDILESLDPDILVHKELGSSLTIARNAGTPVAGVPA